MNRASNRSKYIIEALTEDLQSEDKKAFKVLIKCGVDPIRLKAMLRIVPTLQDKKMAFVRGMADDEVVRLGNRLDLIADQVHRINQSYALNPEAYEDELGHDAVEQFKRLPSVLRSYEKHLSMISRFRKSARHGFNPRKVFLIQLLTIVHDSTGKPHYAEVAQLVQTALRAAGQRTIVNPENLAKLYTRNLNYRIIVRAALKRQGRSRPLKAPAPV